MGGQRWRQTRATVDLSGERPRRARVPPAEHPVGSRGHEAMLLGPQQRVHVRGAPGEGLGRELGCG